MNKLLTYSGINTKLKAMEARLIKDNEYQKIANIESVADFIVFLKNHPSYQEILSTYDEHELHRSDVERILMNSLYTDYTKIYRFANKEQRSALDFIFLRYEINIIKSCLRLIYNPEDNFEHANYDIILRKHSQINLSSLAAASTLEEFAHHIKDTRYYSLFAKIQSSNHTSSFDYENQLDTYYFKTCWKGKDQVLKGINHKIFTRQIGMEIDLQNILWIYRSKAIYNMNTNDILSFIIPINHKLTKDQLIKLIHAVAIDDFVRILQNSYYRFLIKPLQNNTIEAFYHRFLHNIYRSNKNKYPSSIATINYYLHLKEQELSRLTTAIESIRYQLAPQDKLKYIMQ